MKNSIVLLAFVCIFVIACTPVPSECVGIGDVVDTDKCVLDLAFLQNNSDLCSAIHNPDWKTWCYTDIAISTQNVFLCEKITGKGSTDDCIKNIALLTEDVTLCSEIKGTAAGDNCFETMASTLNEGTLCKSVAATDPHNNCFVKVAENSGQYILCTEIQDDDRRRDACLFRVTLQSNMTQGCAEILDTEREEVCYMNHAIKQLDKSLCSLIQTEKMYKACNAAVSLESKKAEKTSTAE